MQYLIIFIFLLSYLFSDACEWRKSDDLKIDSLTTVEGMLLDINKNYMTSLEKYVYFPSDSLEKIYQKGRMDAYGGLLENFDYSSK